MKRTLHIIALILFFALILTVLQISEQLPSDSSQLVEKKYNSWTGVLRAWICSNWRCDGSFNSWLNRCAAAFEKNHPGVYIEFTIVTAQSLNEITQTEIPQTGLRPPELLFFSPGTLNNPSILEPVANNSSAILKNNRVLPVCMGAYAWIMNTDLCESIPDIPLHLPDEPGRFFSRAAEGLAGASSEIEPSDPGLDLGLPASGITQPTLNAFINGELPALIVSQYELSKLIRLRDAGKGPEWRCIPSGRYMYADQLLLSGVVSQHDDSASVRTPLAHAFLQFLLTQECQLQLTSIGAFPTTRLSIYPASSAYSTMEALLRSLPLAAPSFF